MTPIPADLLHALGDLDEALAILEGDVLLALNAPMLALLPGRPGDPVDDWALPLHGLASALAAPLGARLRCGARGEYVAPRAGGGPPPGGGGGGGRRPPRRF